MKQDKNYAHLQLAELTELTKLTELTETVDLMRLTQQSQSIAQFEPNEEWVRNYIEQFGKEPSFF